jgi:putative chitinase
VKAAPARVAGHLDQAAALKHLEGLHERQLGGQLPGAADERVIRRYLELHSLPGGLTAALLHQALPGVKGAGAWVEPVNAACKRFGITDSARRLAAFLGHTAVESVLWRRLEENLAYTTSARLMKVFPSTFKTAQDCAPCLNNPAALANKVYANKMGNGDAASGDGWKYRGRGLIHLTGRDNYVALAKDLGVDVAKDPDLLATKKEYAALSAAWFFKKHGLNELADHGSYQALSKRINKSLQSFPEREARRTHALDALCRAILASIISALSHRGIVV